MNSSPPRRPAVSAARTAGREAHADLAQHAVSGVMAVRVVDDLEVIEVQVQDADRTSAAYLLSQRQGQVVHHQVTVGQPGQRIGEGAARQLVLRGLAGTDVLDVGDGEVRLRLRAVTAATLSTTHTALPSRRMSWRSTA